jgi:hypothetical protein
MRKFLVNWIARPVTWAFPVSLMQWMLGIPFTWEIAMLVVTSSVVTDLVNDLIPEAK